MGKWIGSLVTAGHTFFDQALYNYHSEWAWGILVFLILVLVLIIFNLVWTPAPSGGKPVPMVRKPRAYRLLFLCGALAVVFVAACFAGLG